MLGRIVAPTRVIHGRDDPLVPVACGQDLVARVANAVPDLLTRGWPVTATNDSAGVADAIERFVLGAAAAPDSRASGLAPPL
jgi:pimeloyl-ACP methyl ester carboxylesterase